MKNLQDRIYDLIMNRLKYGDESAVSDLSVEILKAVRDFNTEDFTLTEAAGIRRLIDDALDRS